MGVLVLPSGNRKIGVEQFELGYREDLGKTLLISKKNIIAEWEVMKNLNFITLQAWTLY